MKDRTNKPCDDIFEGLADLLISNGLITHEYHKHYSEYQYPAECLDHKTDYCRIRYGDGEYIIEKTNGVVTLIRRVRIHDEESEDK